MDLKFIRLTKDGINKLSDAEHKEILAMFEDLRKHEERYLTTARDKRFAPEPTKNLKDLLRSQDFLLIGAVPETYELVCGCRITQYTIDKYKEMSVGFVIVKSNFRGKGASEALFAEATNIAKANQVEVINLVVEAANTAAVRAYEKAGFKSKQITMSKEIK